MFFSGFFELPILKQIRSCEYSSSESFFQNIIFLISLRNPLIFFPSGLFKTLIRHWRRSCGFMWTYFTPCSCVFIVGLNMHSPGEYTAKNIVISPNFLVWKFRGKAQFPHSFVRIPRKYAETVSFHKVSTPGN